MGSVFDTDEDGECIHVGAGYRFRYLGDYGMSAKIVKAVKGY